MRKKIVAILVAVVAFCTQHANGETQLDVQFGNGLQAFGYDVVSGDDVFELGTAKKHWGCNIGGVINHYFNHGIGLQGGARMYLYRTTCVLDSSEHYMTRDVVNGMDCRRSVHYRDWNEQQTNLLLAIPVGFAYKTDISEDMDFYAGVGVELLLPLVSQYKVKEGNISVSGYYECYDVEFSDMPVHNFTTYNEMPKGKFSTKVGVAGYLDAGVRYHLAKCDLSAGLYLSYGFSNVATDNEGHLFDLNNKYSGVLNSQTVEKVNPVAFGLKIGVTLPLNKPNNN